MSNDDVIAPGTVVAGKYRVEGPRGSGGMAIILEATQLGTGRRVALKVLKGSSLKSPEAVTRFEREMKVMSRLENEHVARVFDTGATPDGAPYLVMELLEGHDLEGEINLRGRFPPEEATRLVLEACEGVAAAHQCGLLHRDLKPGNLFLAKRADGALTVKVLDFGLSKLLGGDAPLTQTTVNIGTPLYMAPEQIANSRDVELRTDQHALGAILCTLLTGRPPYHGESLTELAVAISVQPPPNLVALVAGVPPGLEAVVHRALAKKPSERYATVADFAEALAPYGGASAPAKAARVRAVLNGLPAEPHPRSMTMPILEGQRSSGEFGRASVPMPPSMPMSAPFSGLGPTSQGPTSQGTGSQGTGSHGIGGLSQRAPLPLPPAHEPAAPEPQGAGLRGFALPLGLAFLATVGMLVGAYFVYTSGSSAGATPEARSSASSSHSPSSPSSAGASSSSPAAVAPASAERPAASASAAPPEPPPGPPEPPPEPASASAPPSASSPPAKPTLRKPRPLPRLQPRLPKVPPKKK